MRNIYSHSFQQISKFIKSSTDKFWYAPLLTVISALDVFLIFLPNDGVLIASSMMAKRRWFLFGLLVAIGSSIGAICLVKLVQFKGLPWILEYFSGANESYMWLWTEKFFSQYGMLLVLLIGFTPFSQQPILILVSMTDFSNPTLIGAIFFGRLLKYLVMAYLGAFAPELFMRWRKRKVLQKSMF